MQNIQTIFNDPYSILYLLPYTKHTELNSKHQKLDDLYFIKSVVNFSLIALETFLDGRLTAFDAQVGENLCQIRAYKTLHLAKKWLASLSSTKALSNIIDQIKIYEEKLEQVIFTWENAIQHAKHFNRSLDCTENIHDFLVRHDLFLELDEDSIFIIACYFLTHFNIRDDNVPVAINLEYIAREFHISKYRSKRLTHKYQLLVCHLGCDFIIERAKELPHEFNYADLLPHLYQVSDENRAVLPCLIVTEIILNHCLKEKMPIFVIVHRKSPPLKKNDIIYFLLINLENTTSFSLVLSEQYLPQYCMVVAGDVLMEHLNDSESPENYVHRFLDASPMRLILANTANHPQYSGKRLEELRHNPFLHMPSTTDQMIKVKHEKNLNDLQQFSLQNGCSKENQSTFFLRHIYASIVADEVNQLQNNHSLYARDAFKIIGKK